MATRAATPRAAGSPLPGDVRFMNAVASFVFVLAALVLAAAAIGWLTRLPVFSLRAIAVQGELSRSSVATVRANAAPRLRGNFFSLDLGACRAAFESVPWVRRAVVRRVWPNRLAVTLEEHRPAAVWEGAEGNDRLVNQQGEVFEANLGDVEDEALPRLSGPAGSAAQMLAMHDSLVPVFAAMDAEIEALHLSGRGSWRAELDSGATVELGRGDPAEVVARADRFAHTLAQVTDRFQRPLKHADLRHADGYAVRLEGVTTTAAAAAAAPARKKR